MYLLKIIFVLQTSIKKQTLYFILHAENFCYIYNPIRPIYFSVYICLNKNKQLFDIQFLLFILLKIKRHENFKNRFIRKNGIHSFFKLYVDLNDCNYYFTQIIKH